MAWQGLCLVPPLSATLSAKFWILWTFLTFVALVLPHSIIPWFTVLKTKDWTNKILELRLKLPLILLIYMMVLMALLLILFMWASKVLCESKYIPKFFKVLVGNNLAPSIVKWVPCGIWDMNPLLPINIYTLCFWCIFHEPIGKEVCFSLWISILTSPY